MIESVVERWLKLLHGEVEDQDAFLDELLSDDVVFYSPVVFTPQHGKAVTKLYLGAAGSVFAGSDSQDSTGGDTGKDRTFNYTKKVLSGNQAMLEFETEIGGKYVNGIDIIECNDEGKIVEFRVMVRPLQAINMMHARMGELLAKLQASGAAA